MTGRFTDRLRRDSEPLWSQATGHRFVRALCDGSIDDAVMAGYLVQDHRFLDSFLALLGAAIATADTLPVRLRFGRSAGYVSGDENDYFLRAFAALGVSEADRTAPADTAPTAGFSALMREAADTRCYAAILSVLCVAEWLYLDWAMAAPRPLPPRFEHAEWITLHDNADFRAFVGMLRSELDRVGPAEEATSRAFFLRAVSLEKAFLDAASDPAGAREIVPAPGSARHPPGDSRPLDPSR